MKLTRPKWRKYDFPKPSEMETPSSGRLRAAKQAVQRDRDAVPLFPEMRKYQDVDERLIEQHERRNRFRQHMRNCRAVSWRNARRRLSALPWNKREALVRWYNTLGCPLDPGYLQSMIYDAEIKRTNFLARLIERNHLRILGGNAPCFTKAK